MLFFNLYLLKVPSFPLSEVKLYEVAELENLRDKSLVIPMVDSFAKLLNEDILIVVTNIPDQLFPKSVLLYPLVQVFLLLNGFGL
jgi:hypothetical protein